MSYTQCLLFNISYKPFTMGYQKLGMELGHYIGLGAIIGRVLR
jgi:hypothetical protein